VIVIRILCLPIVTLLMFLSWLGEAADDAYWTLYHWTDSPNRKKP
jgi:hypothetical protein